MQAFSRYTSGAIGAVIVGAVVLAVPLTAAQAQELPGLDLAADVRLRLEQDWDSTKADGTMRDDRARARIRLRVMANADLGGGFALEGRVRSGIPGSQQNANVTYADFNSNADDTLKLVADRYALAWQGKGVKLQAGRMRLPLRTRHEYLWDGDISPFGVAGEVPLLEGKQRLSLHGGAFLLPVGAGAYSGWLLATQAQLDLGATQFDAGLFRFDADRSDPDRLLLLDGNGERDYTLLALSAQHSIPLAGSLLALSVDLYHNLEDYSGTADAFTASNSDGKTGFVLSAVWGATAAPGDVQLGYRFSHIEQFATNASFSHDDIARFGSTSQARLSDSEGHDLFANLRITPTLSAGVRAMIINRISNGENGKRARLDLSYQF